MMKTAGKIVLAALVGMAIGAVGMRAGQGKVAAGYVVAEIEVTDQAAFQKYSAQVPATLAPFGGHFLARGGNITALEGEAPKRVVLIAFDSAAQAKAWYASPAYSALVPQRQAAAKGRLFVTEGVTP
jgi:uncharacterized protein (DUF1330 family)